MKDYDNGSFVTSSDLYAISADGIKTVQLTKTDDTIEMYPDCQPGISEILYHTLDGNIYLMTVKFE